MELLINLLVIAAVAVVGGIMVYWEYYGLYLLGYWLVVHPAALVALLGLVVWTGATWRIAERRS